MMYQPYSSAGKASAYADQLNKIRQAQMGTQIGNIKKQQRSLPNSRVAVPLPYHPSTQMPAPQPLPHRPAPMDMQPLPYHPAPSPMPNDLHLPNRQRSTYNVGIHNTGIAGGMHLPNSAVPGQMPSNPISDLQRRYAELRALGY